MKYFYLRISFALLIASGAHAFDPGVFESESGFSKGSWDLKPDGDAVITRTFGSGNSVNTGDWEDKGTYAVVHNGNYKYKITEVRDGKFTWTPDVDGEWSDFQANSIKRIKKYGSATPTSTPKSTLANDEIPINIYKSKMISAEEVERHIETTSVKITFLIDGEKYSLIQYIDNEQVMYLETNTPILVVFNNKTKSVSAIYDIDGNSFQ